MPGSGRPYSMPVRPAGGGYGATAAEIARGYKRIAITDTDDRPGSKNGRSFRPSGESGWLRAEDGTPLMTEAGNAIMTEG